MKTGMGLVLGLLVLATQATAAPFTVGASCFNGPGGVWAIGIVNVERDASGAVTGGSVFGTCIDGATPLSDIAPLIKDGQLCKCAAPSGSGKDLYCKAAAVVTDTDTQGSCLKSARP